MVEIRDLGITKLGEQLDALGKLRIEAGVLEPEASQEHSGTDASVGLIAHWLEFGTEKTDGGSSPARPFMRTGLEQNKSAFKKLLKRAVSDLIDGREESARAALQSTTPEIKRGILKTFDRSREWAEANAPSTILAKGHDQPLLGEHVQVREAIEARVAPRTGVDSIAGIAGGTRR